MKAHAGRTKRNAPRVAHLEPAEYRPTGPEFDMPSADDLVREYAAQGMETDAAVRLGLLTQHAKQTGSLPSPRWWGR